MKKSNVKKAVTIVTISMMCFNTTPIFSEGNSVRLIHNNEIVIPMNVAINRTYNELTLGIFGKLTCIGETEVRSGYTAGLIMELQQYDGGWETIKTWSDTDVDWIDLEKSYYVSKGYNYRLKLTHTAYNSYGTLLETITKYSDVVYY